jgi:polyisoprenoid-binding protein YceI
MSTTTETTTETPVLAGSWVTDPTHSTVGFTIQYMGVAPFQGAFREFQASFDEQGIRGTAKASSVDVDNDDLAAHLASPDFFDAANHPELSFEAGSLRRDGDRVTVDGVLEIKGKRAPITLAGTITEPVADPWGGRKLGLSLTGSVDKNTVGLTWNAPLPEGGSMLADEVELTASLVFVPTPEA